MSENIVILSGPESEKITSLVASSMKELYEDAKIRIVTPKSGFTKFTIDSSIQLIDEDEILNKHLFLKKYRELYGTVERALWYYQQFLKYYFVYSDYNDGDHYVVWDGDTVPLKKIEFIKDGKYQLNRKIEYHLPYFNALVRLFPQIDSRNDCPYGHSFISEYMVFDTEIMKEMLQKLGDDPIGQILKAIDFDQRTHSGFSEYETYGTYMQNYHEDRFENICLKTERRGDRLFNKKLPTLEELKNKNLDLHTITFEWRTVWKSLGL